MKRLLKVARREVIRKENLSRVRSPKANFARSSAANLGDRESNQRSLGAVFRFDVDLRIESLQLADLSIPLSLPDHA